MTNKELKSLSNAIKQDLKINNKGNCFVVTEEAKDSLVKRIEITFKNKDDVFIIKQDENKHTIDMLEEYNTSCSCDFIVFLIDNNKLNIYLCEIKSSRKKNNIEKAYKQIQSSKLFLKYLFNAYSHYFNNDIFATLDIDTITRHYYIYPKIGISNKSNVYGKYNYFIFKDIEISDLKNKIARISNGYDFFKVR